jgi:hypothetical protein
MKKTDFYFVLVLLGVLTLGVLREELFNNKPVANEPKLIVNPLFQLVSDSTNRTIEALDGKTKLSDLNDSLDDDYDLIGYNHLSKNYKAVKTDEINVEINRLIKSATPCEIFNSKEYESKEYEMDKYVMTQSQVVKYCRNNYARMMKYDTKSLFLIKGNKQNQYFSIFMCCIEGRLCPLISSLSRYNDCELFGNNDLMVVTPVIDKRVKCLLPEWMYMKSWAN